jgi:hypothetical protein
MMPNCQNCWNEDNVAVFLGPNEVPVFCEKHLRMLEDRIRKYREKHPLTASEVFIKESTYYQPSIELAHHQAIVEIEAEIKARIWFRGELWRYYTGGTLYKENNEIIQDLEQQKATLIGKEGDENS